MTLNEIMSMKIEEEGSSFYKHYESKFRRAMEILMYLYEGEREPLRDDQ